MTTSKEYEQLAWNASDGTTESAVEYLETKIARLLTNFKSLGPVWGVQFSSVKREIGKMETAIKRLKATP